MDKDQAVEKPTGEVPAFHCLLYSTECTSFEFYHVRKEFTSCRSFAHKQPQPTIAQLEIFKLICLCIDLNRKFSNVTVSP